MKKIFSTPFSQKKLFSIFHEIEIENILEKSPEQLLIVVPNRRFKTLLERHIYDFTKGKGFIHPNIISIDDLWIAIINEQYESLAFERKWQRELIIEKAMSRFPEFQNQPNKQSWINVLDKSIVYWEQRMSVEDSEYLNAEWLGDIISDRIKLFGEFYSVYESLGFSCNLISRERLRKYLPEKSDYFKSFTHIVFLSLDEWIPEHWDFLIKKTLDVPNVIFSIDRMMEFSLPYQEDVISKLLSYEYSFSDHDAIIPRDITKYKSVLVNRVEEIQSIASLVRQLSATGHPLHRICIVLKEPDKYLSWIQKIFNEHNISFNYSAGLPISETAVTQLLYAQCALISGELNPNTVKKYCSNPIVSLNYLNPLIDLIRVNYGEFDSVSELKIWIELIKNRISSVTLSDRKKNSFSRFEKVMDVLQNVIESIESYSVRFYRSNSNAERSAIFRDWMLSRMNQNKITDRDLFNYASWTVFQQILNLLEKLGDFDPAILKMSNNDFITTLKKQAENLTWNEPVRDGVQILGALEAKGTDYDIVFIPGLHSRIYPEIQNERLFFSLRDLKNLNDSMEIDQRLIEEGEFNNLVNLPNKALFVSYSPSNDFPDEGSSLFLQMMEIDSPFEKWPSVSHHDARTAIVSEMNTEFEFQIERKNYLRHIKQFGDASRFDGLVRNKISLSLIRDYFQKKNNTISATEFDKYAECGFRFLSDRLLGIGQTDEYSEGFDHLTKGTMLHRILYLFFSELLNEKKSTIINPDNFENYWLRMIDIAEKVVDEADHTGRMTFKKEKEKQRLTNIEISPLRSFLELEMVRSEFAEVIAVEYDFGNISDEFKIRFETMLGEFRLNGRIDRLDRISENNKHVIYDYKTSDKNGIQKLIDHNKSFQFLVYSYAVSELLGDVGGCVYLSLKSKPEKLTDHLSDFWGEINVFKKYYPTGRKGYKPDRISEFTNKIQSVPELLGNVINRMISGDFRLNETAHLAAKGFACSEYCPLSTTCRKDEQRIEVLSKIIDSGDE